MHKKFQWRRYLIALFAGIFAVAGLVVAIDAPAKAAAVADSSTVDYAVTFGANQALSTPDSNALDLSANLTLEFWYKADTNAYRMFMNKEAAYEFAVDVNGKFGYALYKTAWDWNWTPISIPTGRWVHVTFTKSGTTSTLFLDGQNVWTQTGGYTTSNSSVLANPDTLAAQTGHLMIGGRSTSFTWGSAVAQADGMTLDEVKLWNTARSGSEILTDMHSKATTGATGLVGYWNFNEGTASSASANVYDRSGLDHNMTFFGTTTASNGNFVDVKVSSKSAGKTVLTFPRTYLPGVTGWTVPAGVTKADVFVVGGGAGGGGGGWANTGYAGGGGGGGAGGQAVTSLARTITPGDSLLVQVGHGGAGGAGGNTSSWAGSHGSSGFDSKFGSLTASRGFGGWGAGTNDGTLLTSRSWGSYPELSYTPTAQYQDQNGGQGGQSGANRGSQGYGSATYPGVPGAGGGGAGAGGVGTAATSASAVGSGGAGVSFMGTSYGAGASGGLANSGATVSLATVNSGNGGAGGSGAPANGTAATGASGAAGKVIVAFASADDKSISAAGSLNNFAKTTSQIFPTSTTQDYTIDFWVKPGTFPAGGQAIITTPGDNTQTNRLYVGTRLPSTDGTKAKLTFGLGNSTSANNFGTSKRDIKSDEWTHIGLTVSGSTASMYINDVFDSSFSPTRVAVATGLQIGKSDNTSVTQYFNGEIDQVKVWSSALSADQLVRSAHSYLDSDSSQIANTLQHAYDFNLEDPTNGYQDLVGTSHLGKNGSPALTSLVSPVTSGANTYYKFTRSYLTAFGGWVMPSGFPSGSVKALAVAGGGSGGTRHGSGGGAGELYFNGNLSIAAGEILVAKIGQGAPSAKTAQEANGAAAPGLSGQNSQFGVKGSEITLKGGGGGGLSGGSAGGDWSTRPAKTATNSGTYANAGGIGAYTGSFWGGGGGGGAMSSGFDAKGNNYGNGSAIPTSPAGLTGTTPGIGGNGFVANVEGTAKCYGAGGNGGFTGTAGVQAAAATCNSGQVAQAASVSSGIGGTYTTATVNGGDALVNTGSGGGGSGQDASQLVGIAGSGGSGVAIVSVKVNDTVKFDSNNTLATGTMSDQYIGIDSSATLTSNVFSLTGYIFAGWATESGGAVVYADGESVNPSGDITLYAKWNPNSLSVTYANGGGTGTLPTQANVTYNTTFTVAAGTGLNKTNYNFAGWSDGTSVYQSGDTYPAVTTAVTLTATWTIKNYAVTYAAGGGSGTLPTQANVDHGSTFTTPASPGISKTGYSFAGWSDGTNTYASNAASVPVTQAVTLTATWTANNLTVTYDAQNGSADSTGSVATGASISSAPTQPTRAGYTFAGWFVAASGGSAISFPYAHGQTSSFTLYAQWTANTLNVAWDSNSGSAVSGTTTTTGATIASAPTSPTRAGFTFGGWFEQSGLTSQAVFPNYVHGKTANFTLYAKWNANPTRTVTYALAGGTSALPTQSAVQDGLSFTVNANTPVRFGYSFLGWSDGSATYQPSASYAVGASNVTLTATWSADTFNVTWNSNGGSSVATTSTATGGTIASAPTAPTKTGYNFAGWFKESALTNEAIFPNFVHGEGQAFTLYAKWNPGTYTITYTYNGATSGDSTTSSSFTTGGTAITLPAPSKTGFNFAGWYAEPGFSTQVTGAQSPAADRTLYAKWTAGTYTLTYNYNGATSGNTNPTASFTTGGSAITLPAPLKTGYNFDGWFAENTFNTSVTGTQSPTADATIYAKWSAATFTITYKAGANGTGADLTQTFVYGNSASIKDATAPLTRAGYSISGWAATDGGVQSKALSASYSSAADLTLYPVWSANTITVTYDAQGGSSASNGSFTTGSTLTLPAASVRSGYTFQGWFTAATGGTKVGNASATVSPANTADVTLYAQWVAVNYTVTYDANTASSGAVPTNTTHYNIGNSYAVAGNSGSLVKTGYAFGGWTTNSNGTGTVYNSGEAYTFADASVTFYAKWLANTYTITYNSNGATSGSPTNATQTYTSGNAGVTLTTVGSLVKTGYNFGGWSTVAGGAALSGAYTTSADVTLYAVWNVKTINVTYDRGLATSVATFPTNTTAIYGARYSISSMVSSVGTVGGAGLKFVGWSDGVSIYAAGEPYLVGATDVTFTAQWVHVYEVRYTLNGGTGVLLDSGDCMTPNGSGGYVCTDGQQVHANQAPVRAGYNFAGWKDQSNNSIAAGAAFTVNSGSYLLYAQWTPVNYAITYAANGGATAPTETAKNIGDIFTVANGITRTGYSFNGWSDGSRNYGAGASYQVGSSPVTLTAQWVADVYAITYDWNGGTGTATANGSYTVGTSGLTLPTVGDHVKDGFSFAGWSETRGGTVLAGAYHATQSRTLYAVWGAGSYTVTYDANGGTASAASASVVNGGSTVLPSATRDNYVFEGWYSAQTGGSNRGVAAGVFTPTGSTTLYARWTQLSLYGINPLHLTRVGTLTASGINSSYSGSNAGSSVQVTVPANTLPTGTTVNMDLVSDFTRAGNLLNDPANFIVSLVVSWVASDGTVPNTYSGKAVSVTIQNSSIKAGSSVYSILGSQVTLLGTAILDGTVTVSLTQDPEIVIAATKPTAPQTVTAVAGQTGTANVSWSAPSSTGGATITGYTVTASTGQICTSVTTSCVVTGLTSGASYTFTVTATNSVGTSVASAASSSITFVTAPVTSSPNTSGPVAKAPIVVSEKGQQIIEVSQKKVATTGGSVLKIDTKNMEDISNVTVNGKKAKILGIVDGEIKLQIPAGTKGDAKVVFSSPTGNVTMEKVITFVAPKPVDVVASAAMPQGIWTIATPAVQALRKTLLANPDTVLINCVGYQSYAYNTPFDAIVAKQRAKNACAYLASQAPGVAVKTSVVRTKLTGPASRKLKVTFSAVR